VTGAAGQLADGYTLGIQAADLQGFLTPDHLGTSNPSRSRCPEFGVGNFIPLFSGNSFPLLVGSLAPLVTGGGQEGRGRRGKRGLVLLFWWRGEEGRGGMVWEHVWPPYPFKWGKVPLLFSLSMQYVIVMHYYNPSPSRHPLQNFAGRLLLTFREVSLTIDAS
jgi:hypothetical protein